MTADNRKPRSKPRAAVAVDGDSMTLEQVERIADGAPCRLTAAARKRLRASRATFKVLCSPVPFDYRTKGDSLDTWNGYKDERKEIFDFLTKEKIEGIVLMSADRHRSDLWKIQREGAYPLYEFNSSRLTNDHVHGEMKEAIFSYNKKQSFGLVTFDRENRGLSFREKPTLSYYIGQAVLEFENPEPDRETRPQFLPVEGFRDIVVGAGFQSHHDVIR